MNNTIINTFNKYNSRIANTDTQHRQVMTIVINRIFKFESMIKKPIVASYTFFAVITFKINSFVYINSIVISIYNTHLPVEKTNLHQP